MASAWCAYQSNLWSGVQMFRLVEANAASRKASELNIVALHYRAADAASGRDLHGGDFREDKKLADFLLRSLRPELKKAVDAWLATDPLHNPAAPRSPFKMAEYVQQELIEAKHQDELSLQQQTAGQKANENSDNYILLTVLFASVMFFGGIGGTFQSHPWRERGFRTFSSCCSRSRCSTWARAFTGNRTSPREFWPILGNHRRMTSRPRLQNNVLQSGASW